MDNMDHMDDEIDHIIDAMSEQVAHNTLRLDSLLSRLQERLSRDYTHIPIAIGTLMVLGGFLHIYFRGEFIFSLTALIWGALILSLTLFFRYRIIGHLTKFGDALVKLDQDRQDHARKLSVIENLIREGIPSDLSLNHILILLGEHKESNGSNNDIRPENN
jgi:hypothetical protein